MRRGVSFLYKVKKKKKEKKKEKERKEMSKMNKKTNNYWFHCNSFKELRNLKLTVACSGECDSCSEKETCHASEVFFRTAESEKYFSKGHSAEGKRAGHQREDARKEACRSWLDNQYGCDFRAADCGMIVDVVYAPQATFTRLSAVSRALSAGKPTDSKLFVKTVAGDGRESVFNIRHTFHQYVGYCLDKRTAALKGACPFPITFDNNGEPTEESLFDWFLAAGL